MYELPTSITLKGIEHPIRNDGDYRMVLDCFNALNDMDLDKTERVMASLIIFYEELTDIEDIESVFPAQTEDAIKAMYDFFNCNQPDMEKSAKSFTLIDWDKDEMLISSAINKVAGKEIRQEEYIHWWTFMGYYISIGQSILSTVVNIRHKIATKQNLEKWEKKYKIDNPQYFSLDLRSLEQKEADEFTRNVWNKS